MNRKKLQAGLWCFDYKRIGAWVCLELNGFLPWIRARAYVAKARRILGHFSFRH